MNTKHLCFVLCAAAALSAPATAAVILDNADPPLFTTNRNNSNSGIEGVAAYLAIGASDVAIGETAINAQPLQSGQLKFVIFSDVAPPGNNAGSLLFSDTVNVSASGSLAYILSDPFSFTLQAGHYYDIGAIFSGTNINYTYDLTPDTENGISSIVANQNVDNFSSPTLVGHGAADINIRLYSPSAMVPEPGSMVLGIVGLPALVALLVRRRGHGTRLGIQ
ncbi:MAG: PEP-CTERM sorting domain-containing protein [Acidobacteriaceae bacterium]|nr:PEP-CTERM sorting domain-containing protein [Acidobacteriaceae bacterium]